MSELSGLLTAILFVAGDPVEKADLCAWTGAEEEELEAALADLEAQAARGAGLTIIHMEAKVQLVTSPRYAERLRDIFRPSTGASLSSALLETLTIIAYQQPVTRAEVEQIRGVRSVYPIATLSERGLIQKVGSKPVLGTPSLYGTTDDFLRQFGLSSLKDLPTLQPEDAERIPKREDDTPRADADADSSAPTPVAEAESEGAGQDQAAEAPDVDVPPDDASEDAAPREDAPEEAVDDGTEDASQAELDERSLEGQRRPADGVEAESLSVEGGAEDAPQSVPVLEEAVDLDVSLEEAAAAREEPVEGGVAAGEALRPHVSEEGSRAATHADDAAHGGSLEGQPGSADGAEAGILSVEGGAEDAPQGTPDEDAADAEWHEGSSSDGAGPSGSGSSDAFEAEVASATRDGFVAGHAEVAVSEDPDWPIDESAAPHEPGRAAPESVSHADLAEPAPLEEPVANGDAPTVSGPPEALVEEAVSDAADGPLTQQPTGSSLAGTPGSMDPGDEGALSDEGVVAQGAVPAAPEDASQGTLAGSEQVAPGQDEGMAQEPLGSDVRMVDVPEDHAPLASSGLGGQTDDVAGTMDAAASSKEMGQAAHALSVPGAGVPEVGQRETRLDAESTDEKSTCVVDEGGRAAQDEE